MAFFASVSVCSWYNSNQRIKRCVINISLVNFYSSHKKNVCFDGRREKKMANDTNHPYYTQIHLMWSFRRIKKMTIDVIRSKCWFFITLTAIDDDDGVIIRIWTLVWAIFFDACLIQFSHLSIFQSEDCNGAIAAALAKKATTKNSLKLTNIHFTPLNIQYGIRLKHGLT